MTGPRPFLGLRQPVSGLSHLAGAVLSLLGLIWLVRLGEARTTAHVASFAVFGGSMLLLYLASSAYHLLPLSPRGIEALRRVDHAAIFVFIAGCYTPVCLLAIRDRGGLPLLVVVWTLATLGCVLKIVAGTGSKRSRWVTVGVYLLMGWLSVIALPALVHALTPAGLAWLCAGGAAYTLGSVVYALRRPDPLPHVVGFHEIWHVFVLGGSACHFFMIKDGLGA